MHTNVEQCDFHNRLLSDRAVPGPAGRLTLHAPQTHKPNLGAGTGHEMKGGRLKGRGKRKDERGRMERRNEAREEMDRVPHRQFFSPLPAIQL